VDTIAREAAACRDAGTPSEPQTAPATPGAPPTFGTGVGSGPEVSPATFAEAEKLMQVTMTAAERQQAADAAGSDIIQRLNPPQRFPAVDTSVRRWPGMAVHPVDVGGTELTPDEYYVLGLSLDMGGQFFSRENKDEPMTAVGP
jgi:hypothetical protein